MILTRFNLKKFVAHAADPLLLRIFYFPLPAKVIEIMKFGRTNLSVLRLKIYLIIIQSNNIIYRKIFMT